MYLLSIPSFRVVASRKLQEKRTDEAEVRCTRVGKTHTGQEVIENTLMSMSIFILSSFFHVFFLMNTAGHCEIGVYGFNSQWVIWMTSSHPLGCKIWSGHSSFLVSTLLGLWLPHGSYATLPKSRSNRFWMSALVGSTFAWAEGLLVLWALPILVFLGMCLFPGLVGLHL